MAINKQIHIDILLCWCFVVSVWWLRYIQ